MGVLASPNYPDNYPHDRTCEWVLSAATNRQFLINVTDISLEQHENCSYDFLEIRLSLVVVKYIVSFTELFALDLLQYFASIKLKLML